MEHRMTDIQAPVPKAVTALGASGGSSAVSMIVERTSFMPQTFAEYLACLSAGVAIIYTSCLLIEWVVKKIVNRGFAK